jgi:hypothetical protein
MCNLVQAVEVSSTGYGSSFDEALQNAKVLATEYAASTFITGKQELVDGKYKEALGQYNGGLVRKYEVTNTSTNSGMYNVTILANVDTRKVNEIITNGDVAVNVVVPQVEQKIDDLNKIRAAWQAISATSNPFAYAVDSVKYDVDGSDMDIKYQLHMQWNPKWVDDSKQLAAAINQPINAQTHDALCWTSKKQPQPQCSNVGVVPMEQLYSGLTFKATLHFIDGTTEEVPWAVGYARAVPKLYGYDKWYSISAKDDVRSCGKNIIPGVLQAIVKIVDDDCFKRYSVETVIIDQDAVVPFSFRFRIPVEKFKKVDTVSFAPDW